MKEYEVIYRGSVQKSPHGVAGICQSRCLEETGRG